MRILKIIIVINYGSIAQLGEHLPYKQGVIGSSPIVPTIITINIIKEKSNYILAW